MNSRARWPAALKPSGTRSRIRLQFKRHGWGFGRITAKAEIPPANGSQINVLLGMAQVVICALNFDTNFLKTKTFGITCGWDCACAP
jgi:hypothetical protein